jgi:hypothetical protein
MTGEWHLKVTSTGGFAGRGIGQVAISSSDPFPEVARAVQRSLPKLWRASYCEDYDAPGGGDEIRYALELRCGPDRFATSWSESDFPVLPHDLAELFESAWRTRR